MKKYWRNSKEHGAITLEAAIVVPAFVFLMVFVYGFINMFMGRQQIAHAMIQSAKSLSLETYSLENLKGSAGESIKQVFTELMITDDPHYASAAKWYSDDKDSLQSIVEDRFIGYLAGTRSQADKALKQFGVEGGISGLDFSKTKVQDGYLIISIDYIQNFIYDFQGLVGFDKSMEVKIKLWAT